MEFLVDKINIKDLPEIIVSFLRKHSSKKYNNLRFFYSKLLGDISEDIKDSNLNRILKYLSSDSPSTINIIDDFNDGIYDNELNFFCDKLSDYIRTFNDYENLYEDLNQLIIYIFFNKDEYLVLKKLHNEKKYNVFLFNLLKHAFSSYKYNIPGIVAKRFYNEALTLIYDSEHRKRLMKASADLGNSEACMQYASMIYKDIDLSIKYYAKTKSMESALWEIGFALEHDWLKKETKLFLLKEIGDYFIEDDFTNNISVNINEIKNIDSDSILMAVKIYNYIIKKYNFSKAINSIGKLLVFNKIIYCNSRQESIKIAKQYLKKAIKLGNLNAMTNLSIYFANHPEDNEYDYEMTKRLFKFSADLGDIEACYYYGKILIKEEKDNLALKYLTYAEERNNKFACFELGKYYELKQDFQKSIMYYKRAISLYYYDSAYYLALLYFQMDIINKDYEVEYKKLAKRCLEDYFDRLSENIKEQAQDLLQKLN